MDNRPIGVFDSGLGGLTAVKEITRLLPHEDIIYCGDTGRVPYGGRSRETIKCYVSQAINFLLKFDIKLIVIACGTASAAAKEIFGNYPVPVIGVVEPSAAAVVKSTRNGKIGVTATQASIGIGEYERKIIELMPSAAVISRAAPLFVPLVENGYIKPGDRITELAVEDSLRDIREYGIDTLLLGCTHYPLLSGFIKDYMGGGVKLIDSGAETVSYVKNIMVNQDILNTGTNSGSLNIYVSDATENFSNISSMFLEKKLDGIVNTVDLNRFAT